ncbi:MAG: ATP-binding protein [Planctomycetes bacterium]|nr:ATP-binding protein [Planctomycetota bacterium]
MNALVSFNPFNKTLEKLVPDDLAVLREVAEGWYIEYKGQLVRVKSIAKSISAFANHYGGWLFYGIEEADDGSNTAGSFPGLDQSDVTLLIEQIRNAVKDVINPSPYYEYKILTGPSAEIGLPNNKSVVVVTIPSGPNAPYIHSDGRIYRRVADSSDPKPETDRFILDQLWQRGQKSQAQLASFLQTELILSKGEDELSYFELFLLPDPLGAAGQHSNLTFDQFVELMTDTTIPGTSVPCDNFYTMAGGFIGRQISTNDPYNLVFTWRHYTNGFSVVSVPFASAPIDTIEIGGWLHGYEQETTLLKLIPSRRHSTSHLLDINQLLLVIVGAINQQRRLMELGGIRGPLYAKAALRNIWRRIPFLDTERYIRLVSEYGFPVIQFTEEFAPRGTTFDSLVLIPENDMKNDRVQDTNELGRNQGWRAAHILGQILNAVGLSIKAVLPDEDEKDQEFEWWNAALRAPNVGKHRTQHFG